MATTLLYSIISIDDFVKNISTICLKKAIDQYIQDTIQVFQIWHNLCSELSSM
jgi:hypothetical protein